jgi:DNA-binding GntR family transcriptional regulator
VPDRDPEIVYPRLSERIYEYLCDRIIEGNIRYGERISIKSLSERLKVSTMPVRDALKMLENEGVVQINPRSNCLFKVPTRKSILDAFDMREMLELQAMETIYPTITGEELAVLERTVKAMGSTLQGALTPAAIRRYIALDRTFHMDLCTLSKNEYLMKFYREVNLHLSMTSTYRIGADPNVSGTYADHKQMVELLKDCSPKTLDVLEGHLERSREEIINGTVFQSLD